MPNDGRAPHLAVTVPPEYLVDDPYDDDEQFCYSKTGVDNIWPGKDDPEDFHCRTILQSQVNLLDDVVGQIVDKLQEQNLWDSTLVIFGSDNVCSDLMNGPMFKSSLHPLNRDDL